MASTSTRPKGSSVGLWTSRSVPRRTAAMSLRCAGEVNAVCKAKLFTCVTSASRYAAIAIEERRADDGEMELRRCLCNAVEGGD